MKRTHQFRALALATATTLALSAPLAAKQFGPWGDAQPAPGINTPGFSEGCPIEDPDGLSLYIASNRPGGHGALDIWRAERASLGSPWNEPTNLGPVVNSADFDFCPTPLRGKWLLFVSSRDTEGDGDPSNDDCLPGPPGAGSPPPGDIFITFEHPVHGWREPLHLGCVPDGPNTAGAEFSPSLVDTAEGMFLFFSSNGYGDGGGFNIYASRVLADGTVLPGTRIDSLSTLAHDHMPNVRKDGLEIVFISDRDSAPGQFDIYIASRASTAEDWSTPERIENPSINHPVLAESRPSLSGDGSRLHFGRSGDVFVATRAHVRGRSQD